MKKIRNIYSATVLVYTLVLVVIGVIMATVILNVAIQLSIEYDIRNLETSLRANTNSKSELSFKYMNEVNSNWGGFIDKLWCPTNITMSGSSLKLTNLSSVLSYSGWIVSCEWSFNGSVLSFYFNSNFTDLSFAEYKWFQVVANSWSQSWTFSDSENTFLSLSNSYPLVPDSIDDNFDSDNYTVYSTWSSRYPNWYFDDDAEARLLSFWYILPESGLYNIFWSNSKMEQYIEDNTNNNDTYHQKIASLTNWILNLDINKTFRAILYVINKNTYNETSEFIIENTVTWTWETASIWYLQNDMSLSSSKAGAYTFDFTQFDYALFLENTSSSWAMLYKLGIENLATGSWVYMNPIDDSKSGITSYLWSHILIDTDGRLIADQFEISELKSKYYYTPKWMDLWLDAADQFSISSSGWVVSQWRDKSWKWNNLSQSTIGDRPVTWVSTLNSLNTLSFTQDYLTLWTQKNYKTLFFVVQNANGSDSATNVSPIFWENIASWSSYTFINTNVWDSSYDISVDWNVWDSWTAYFGWSSYTSLWTDIDLGLTNAQVKSPSIWLVVQNSSTPFDFIGWLTNGTLFKWNMDIAEIISYDSVLPNSEINDIWGYLSKKWNLPWQDL